MMNYFILADRLHKTVGEIRRLPIEEITHWFAYLEIQADEMKNR
jgi:hypothetical protein